MAANALRLRRSLALTSSILNHSKHSSSVLPSVAPASSPFTIQQNPKTNVVSQSKPSNLSFHFISSRGISSRARYNNDDMDGDQLSPDAILFEGCDYNHWLITMDFPKDPKPSPEEMVETYVQTAAKVLGSVEEAKQRIYACSTTTYNGFQVEVSEEVSEQFKTIPGVVFVLPDSYIDPVNKEYGGDKYINGTIIPRPPPVQYGRQGGRYNDRNRSYNRPPSVQGNYQGDRRGPNASYPGNHNQGGEGGGGNYRQGTEGGVGGGGYGGQYGQPSGGNYRQGAGGGGNYGRGIGGQYGQGGGGGGQYGQGGGGGGQYGQGGGGGGQYGQGGGGGGQYGQGGGGGGQYGQGGGGGGQYGQGGGGGGYMQGGGRQYGQRGGGNYGQGVGGGYGQGGGSGSGVSASQYGENSRFPETDQRRDISGQQGNHEAAEEAEVYNGR